MKGNRAEQSRRLNLLSGGKAMSTDEITLAGLLADYEERAFIRYCECDEDKVRDVALSERDDEVNPIRCELLLRAYERSVRWRDAISHLPR
jgi:hypothetical protein